MCGSRGSSRWRGCILNDDDFPESAVTVDLLDLAVVDSKLMGAFAFAGGDWRGGHDGRGIHGGDWSVE
jgi:hypothetical protein